MQQLTKSDWENLVAHSAARWNMPSETAVSNMVSVIRHGVYDPALALIISTAGLLKMNPNLSTITASWIDNCHLAAKTWLKQYREIEHHCLQKTDDEEQACRCILSQIGPLFRNSVDLYQTGTTLVAQLPKADEDEAYTMLLRALGRLSRLSTELANNDLSWLLSYIDDMTY